MSFSGDLFLNDIARAFAALKPTDEHARRLILGACGFARGTPREALTERPTVTAPMQDDLPLPSREAERSRAGARGDAGEARPTAGPSGPLPQLVAQADPDLALEPLFRPAWARGLLAAALATAAAEGDIDVERIVDQLARAQPLQQVPRVAVPTLRNGIQLLLDKREAMNPFLRDQGVLLETVRRIVGRELTMVFTMSRTPLRVRREGFLGGWMDYVPPRAGTPVLLVSDLGIGQPGLAANFVPPGDWLAFASLLRRAGCPLLAFVPYPPSRCPQEVAGRFPIVTWDRRTTAAAAARAVRARGRAG